MRKEEFLFLAVRKPFVSVGAQTLSRWIKLTLAKAGIDIKVFSGHSTRHASTSAALSKGLDVDTIKKTAGWSERSEVFAKYYNRPIISNKKSSQFALAILRKNNK